MMIGANMMHLEIKKLEVLNPSSHRGIGKVRRINHFFEKLSVVLQDEM